MIKLARHIELLLLEHDCVIVPGFGGFIASHAEARYEHGAEALFLPPYRTIGFNQQLKINDGLLVQSYMTAYDASYPAAYLQMEKEVELMVAALECAGVYELEGVGVLTKGLNGSISFASNDAGILTPSLYGLYSFEMQSLANVIKEEEARKALLAASSQTSLGTGTDAGNVGIAMHGTESKDNESNTKKSDIVIRLRRRWVDIAVSTAAAVLLFFCFTYPALHVTNNSDICAANVAPAPTTSKVKAKSDAKNAKTNSINTVAQTSSRDAAGDKKSNSKITKPETNRSETKAKEQKEQKSAQQPLKGKVSIVLASCVKESNAKEYIEMLSKKGFPEARCVAMSKMNRVLYSSYATKNEAYAALKELRKRSDEFAAAWVLEEK